MEYGIQLPAASFQQNLKTESWNELKINSQYEVEGLEFDGS